MPICTKKHLRLINKSVFTLRETGDEASFAIAWQRTETNREKLERAKKKGNLSRFSEDHQKRKREKRKTNNPALCFYLYRCSLFSVESTGELMNFHDGHRAPTDKWQKHAGSR